MFEFERRYLDRIGIPGAEVEYRLDNGDSAKVKIIDFTKISIRFFVKHTVCEGDYLELLIKVKDKYEIFVKGHVIWTLPEGKDRNATAVVQFLPFGTNEQINSIESYEQLSQLEKEYSEELKVLNNIYKF
jgi:hypothetical protein